MRKVKDDHHVYHGYHTPGAVCRVRIYEEDGLPPVFLVSEVPENTNTSITNLAEYLAAEVVLTYNPALFEAGTADPFRWIEHYPRARAWGAATYDHVTFDPCRPRLVQTHAERGQVRVRLGTPHWRRLTPQQVAALIGQPLDE